MKKLTLIVSGVALLSLSQFQLACALDEAVSQAREASGDDFGLLAQKPGTRGPHSHSNHSHANDPSASESQVQNSGSDCTSNQSVEVAQAPDGTQKQGDDPCCQESEKVVLRIEPNSSVAMVSALSVYLPIAILSYRDFFKEVLSFSEREDAEFIKPPPLVAAISNHISSTILRV